MKFNNYPSVDCPDRKQLKDYDDGWMLAECMNTASPHTASCEYNRHPDVKLCPRGFILEKKLIKINKTLIPKNGLLNGKWMKHRGNPKPISMGR